MVPNESLSGETHKGDPILIIGAGPAGLVLACELQRRGIASLILERGTRAGESWRRMPVNLRLVSLWKSNLLPGASSYRFPRHRILTGGEYARYLEDYVHANGLAVFYETTVVAAERDGEGRFLLRTSRGQIQADCLVNATGYFARPHVPEFPGARDTTIPRFHFAHYGDSERARALMGKSVGRVLVVGQRLSAGQVIEDLMQAGHEVSLSHRGPLRFGAGPVGTWIYLRALPWIEGWKRWGRVSRERPLKVPMPGGRLRRWIRSGGVRCFPAIRRFERERVAFINGESIRPDLVIYATGFRPALEHLKGLDLEWDADSGRPALHGFESACVPGLYFLGLDMLRDFRSRFLRGIRDDACLLADRLQARLGQSVSGRTFPGLRSAVGLGTEAPTSSLRSP